MTAHTLQLVLLLAVTAHVALEVLRTPVWADPLLDDTPEDEA